PPPTNAKLAANILGKEASCPSRNRALSENPAVRELPTATYLVKSADPAVYSMGVGSSLTIGLSSSQAVSSRPRIGRRAKYFFIGSVLFFFEPLMESAKGRRRYQRHGLGPFHTTIAVWVGCRQKPEQTKSRSKLSTRQ